MGRLKEIQTFVMNNKKLFTEGITITNVAQKWNAYQKKQPNNERRHKLDTKDIVDALTSLRKLGKLKNNFKLGIMEYV